MSLTTAFKETLSAFFDATDDIKKTVTYTRVTEGETNVFNDISDTESTSSVEVMVYPKNDSPLGMLLDEEKHTGELECVLEKSSVSFEPSTNDTVTIDSTVYAILRIKDFFGIFYLIVLDKKR